MSKQRDRRDTLEEELRNDPVVRRTIERAVAPYRKTVSPELLEILEAMVEDALVTHPYAVGIVQQLRARPGTLSTGVEAKHEMSEPASAAGSDRKGPRGA